MSDSNQPGEIARRAGRAAIAPLTSRLDAVRSEMDLRRAEQARVSATLEQVVAANARLEAYFDRFREEIRADFGSVIGYAEGARSMIGELAPDDQTDPGTALRKRLDEIMFRAESAASESRERVDQQIKDLRSSARLTQAMLDRSLANGSGTPTVAKAAPYQGPPLPEFSHEVPTFALLYRTFEDRHRGDPEEITERQGHDYLHLIQRLPNEELPVADLGCGRGELVRLLDDVGITARGIDSNHGQIAGGEQRLFVEEDLFQWLDTQDDASHRAILSMHVVEHLPLDLQIRLVFEASRVLADGGALILETPNAMSMSTAATNFWVDPTHQRPVHPAFLEFLADQAGFVDIELRPLHDLPASFRGGDTAPELVEDLNSLILGKGDLALIARR